MGAGDQTPLGGRHGDGDVSAVEEERTSHTNGNGDVANDVFTAGTKNLAIVEVVVGQAAQGRFVFQTALCIEMGKLRMSGGEE